MAGGRMRWERWVGCSCRFFYLSKLWSCSPNIATSVPLERAALCGRRVRIFPSKVNKLYLVVTLIFCPEKPFYLKSSTRRSLIVCYNRIGVPAYENLALRRFPIGDNNSELPEITKHFWKSFLVCIATQQAQNCIKIKGERRKWTDGGSALIPTISLLSGSFWVRRTFSPEHEIDCCPGAFLCLKKSLSKWLPIKIYLEKRSLKTVWSVMLTCL